MVTKKELKWSVVIRKDKYQITFSADAPGIVDGPVQIEKMYILEKNGLKYVLLTLTNGTYRLYSKAQKKLYFSGKRLTLRFLPVVMEVAETGGIH